MAQYGPQLWLYATGDPAANQPAAVFGPGDQNTFAAIYSDPEMTVPLPNPTTTDANGNLEFYAADGIYWIFVGPVGTGDSIMINLGASGGQVLSVNGVAPDGTGNVELTAEDLDAVPETRQVIAGDGLTGGGVLSANVTLDVNFGTTAGTTAEGNDARIVGAQQRGVIQAKGDLYVGTANDTTSRLGAGTNGQVLSVNSATSTGLEWVTPLQGTVESVNGVTPDVDGNVELTPADLDAVAATTTENVVYGTTTAGAPLNREISMVASPDTVAWRTSEEQLRATTVADGDPAADPDDLTNRAYVADKLADYQLITTIDAAGDLYVGTGPDTTARLPAGPDGQYLRANSALPVGLEYASITATGVGAVAAVTTPNIVYGTTAGGAVSNREVSTIASADTVAVRTDAQQLRALTVADNSADAQATDLTNRSYVASVVNAKLPFAVVPRADEYFQASGVITVRTVRAATLNVMYLYPIPVMRATTLTGVAWETTTTVANSVVRLGLYGASVTGHGVGDLIADFGTFATDTTGVVAAAVSQAMDSGLYWLAFTPQVAVPNFRYGAGWNPYVGSTSFPNGTGTGWNNCYFQASVSGALPTTPTLDGSTDAPVVGVKYA